jgi:hypothetical protein
MPTPRLSWKLVFLLVVLAVLGLGGGFAAAWTWPQRTTREVLRAFREVAGIAPQITVHDRVVFEQTKDALELAVEREMEHEILGDFDMMKRRLREGAEFFRFLRLRTAAE